MLSELDTHEWINSFMIDNRVLDLANDYVDELHFQSRKKNSIIAIRRIRNYAVDI